MTLRDVSGNFNVSDITLTNSQFNIQSVTDFFWSFDFSLTNSHLTVSTSVDSYLFINHLSGNGGSLSMNVVSHHVTINTVQITGIDLSFTEIGTNLIVSEFSSNSGKHIFGVIHGLFNVSSLTATSCEIDIDQIHGQFLTEATSFTATKFTLSNVALHFATNSLSLASNSQVQVTTIGGHFAMNNLISKSSSVSIANINEFYHIPHVLVEHSTLVFTEITKYVNISTFECLSSTFRLVNIGQFALLSDLDLSSCTFSFSNVGDHVDFGKTILGNSNVNLGHVGDSLSISEYISSGSHFRVPSTGNDLTMSTVTSTGGSFTIDSVGGDLLSDKIETFGTPVRLSNISGNIHRPELLITGAFLTIDGVTGEIDTPLLIIDGGADVLLKSIDKDVIIHVLRIIDGTLQFEDLSGNLIILGMSLDGGELIFADLNAPLEMTFLDVTGAKVVFNSGDLVTIRDFSIDGNSTITGSDFVQVLDNFHWFEGTFDHFDIEIVPDAYATINSNRLKLLKNSSLTIECLCDVKDNCIVDFAGDSELAFSPTSDVNMLSDTTFLNSSLSSESSVLLLHLLGRTILNDMTLIVEPKLIMNNEVSATTSSVFLRNGCEVSGKMEFFGTSKLVLQDHGTYNFDSSSQLIGTSTSLEGSQSPNYVNSRPTVNFRGVWQLNPAVAVNFGYFYFRETSTFTINSISVTSLARVYVYTNNNDFNLDWNLESVHLSGSSSRLEFIDLFRNTTIHNFNINNGYVRFLRVYNDVTFVEPITVNSGTLLFQQFPNVELPKITVTNNGLFRTTTCQNLKIYLLDSTSSTITFQSNPDSVVIGDLNSILSTITSTTGHTVFVTNFLLDRSNLVGSDQFDVGKYTFTGGLNDVPVVANEVYLTTSNTKTLGVFHRNSDSSITVRQQGQWSSGRLQGFAGTFLRVNSGASFEVSTNEHLHYAYMRTVPSYNITNAPTFLIYGSVSKTSSTLMRIDFKFRIYAGGKFDLQSGEIFLLGGGFSYGELTSSYGTTMHILPSRTLFAIVDTDRHFHLYSSSVSVIMGTVNLELYSVWTVAGSLEITHQSFDAGSVFFLEGFSLKAGSWTCSDFFKLVAVKAFGDVSFEDLHLSDGASATFADFSASSKFSLRHVTVDKSVIRFDSNVDVETASVFLKEGTVEGTDQVFVSGEFAWKNGRIGSLQHFSESLSLTFGSSSVNKMYSNHIKHLTYDTSITNDGHFYVIDNHLFFTYSGVSITNNNHWQHGSLCGGSICDNLSGFVYRVYEISGTSRGIFTNTGTFVKLSGTLATTNQLRFTQTNSGHFILQSSTFTQHLSTADLDGQFDLSATTGFWVTSCTATVQNTGRFEGLQGFLRTSSGTIHFNGYYGVTRALINSWSGTFNFNDPSDIELNTISITNGIVRFYNAKERPGSKNLFDLTSITQTRGTLQFLNVQQPMTVGSHTQTGTTTTHRNSNGVITGYTYNRGTTSFATTQHSLTIGPISLDRAIFSITDVGTNLVTGNIGSTNSIVTVNTVGNDATFGAWTISNTQSFSVSNIGRHLKTNNVNINNVPVTVSSVGGDATFGTITIHLQSFLLSDVDGSLTSLAITVSRSLFDCKTIGQHVTTGNINVHTNSTFSLVTVGQSLTTGDVSVTGLLQGYFYIYSVGAAADFGHWTISQALFTIGSVGNDFKAKNIEISTKSTVDLTAIGGSVSFDDVSVSDSDLTLLSVGGNLHTQQVSLSVSSDVVIETIGNDASFGHFSSSSSKFTLKSVGQHLTVRNVVANSYSTMDIRVIGGDSSFDDVSLSYSTLTLLDVGNNFSTKDLSTVRSTVNVRDVDGYAQLDKITLYRTTFYLFDVDGFVLTEDVSLTHSTLDVRRVGIDATFPSVTAADSNFNLHIVSSHLTIGNIDLTRSSFPVFSVGGQVVTSNVVLRSSSSLSLTNNGLDVSVNVVSLSSSSSFVIRNIFGELTTKTITLASSTFDVDSVGTSITISGDVTTSGTSSKLFLVDVGQNVFFQDITANAGALKVEEVGLNLFMNDVSLGTSSTFTIDTIGQSLDFDSYQGSGTSRCTIDKVTLNTTFSGFVSLSSSARLTLQTLDEWLVFALGASITGSSHLTASTIKKVLLHSNVCFLTDDLFIGEKLTVTTTSAVVSINTVGRYFFIGDELSCSAGAITVTNVGSDSFFPYLITSSGCNMAMSNIQRFLVPESFTSGASLTVTNYLNSFIKSFTIQSSGSNTFTSGTQFFNVPTLDSRGSLQVTTIDTVSVDDATFHASSTSNFFNAATHCDFPIILGNGGNFEIRNTPRNELLFNIIGNIFDCPSFSISGNSRVELRSFDFEPVLFDIVVTDGRLRLNSTETVHIDHLLIDGVNGGRDGHDLAIVYHGIDYEAGWFQDGRTESLYPLTMTTSQNKVLVRAQLVAFNNTFVDVEGGSILGAFGSLIDLHEDTHSEGDFHFTTSMTGVWPNVFPVLQNRKSFTFRNMIDTRQIDWRIQFLADTENVVLDGTLSLGRGGGLVDTNITLCPDCGLNFNSNMGFSSSARTYHNFTSNSAISCPTCRVHFQTNGAWIKFAGIFDLDLHHIQNYGRLEFLDTAMVPITHWTLQNCDVHFLRAQLFHVSPGAVYVLADTVLNRCGRLVIRESRYALEFIDLHISGGLLEIIDQQHTLNTTVTLIDGNGAFRIESLLYPLIGEGFIINNGYLRLDTNHTVSLQFINMSTPHPDDVVSFTCLSSIGYSAWNSPHRHNITGLYGTDDVEINDLNWLGGSIEVGRLDIFDTLYSDKADDRGFHGFGQLYIHTLAYLGGPGDIYVSGPVHWYILPDSEVNMHSTLNFKSDSNLENYLYNDGDLFFPIENSVIELHFEVHQRHLFESHHNVTVIYNGPSFSSGDYILHPKSRLLLNYFNHNFNRYVTTTGPGNIHMHQWYYTQNNDWKDLTVFFDGRWEISTFYEQDYGRWIFGPHAFLNFTDVQLTQRTHTTIDNSRPASGNWTFDLFSIAVNSWFVIGDLEDEIVSNRLIMSSDEFIRFVNSARAVEFTDVELYDGEVEFSTGHNLHFFSLIVDGGTLSGRDTITVDSFIWRCGRIEGDSNGVSGTIHVRFNGFIETCKVAIPSNPNPYPKMLFHGSILNFRATSHLEIDTTNQVFLYNSSSIEVRGSSLVRAVHIDGIDHLVRLHGSVSAEGNFYRNFSVHLIIAEPSEFSLRGGVIYPTNQLDVYGTIFAYDETEILFTRPFGSSRFVFHESSTVYEFTLNPLSPSANFEPLHPAINVFIKGSFAMIRLSYSLATITFTGPIDLGIQEIILDGTALLHFDALDNDLGSVRGFQLRQNSIMKFSTGQGLVTFDGAGLLSGNAEIVGYGDNVLIIPAVNGTADEVFTWSGGGFAGDIVVDIFSTFEVIGNSDKRLRGGATVIVHDKMMWQSSGHMTGFDKSRIIVSKTGDLQFASSGGFSCRTSTSYFIDDPCVCDSELIINGSATVVPFTQRVSFCWGVTVNGEINVNFGRIESYSFLSGNGQFNVGSLGRIWFSNFHADGQISLLYGTVVYIQGIFYSSVDVSIREGTLYFDDDAFLVRRFDLTVETGDAIFRVVEQMVPLGVVTCQNGDVTLNSLTVVNISTLNLIAGMVHGYDEVHILEHLNWQGGGFGLSTHYVVLNSATALVTGVDHDRYMLPNAKIINQGQFEFRQPFVLTPTEVLFINDIQGVLTLTNSLSFMDSNFNLITNTLINYGDMQCNLASLRMRFKFLNNASVSVNSGEFYAEGGALSYGQLNFSPGTTLKSRINPVIFENYPTSTIDGESFTFDIIHSLGLISVRNYFTSTDFTVKSLGNLVFEKGAMVSTFSYFEVFTTFVTFEAHSNFTAKGQLKVNSQSTTTIRGIHNGYYHGIVRNSYLLYDNASVLSGLLDFTIHTGDVEFKAVIEMLQMDEVTCINGDLTLSTNFIVNISTLNLIAGMVHGYDEVHILEHLNWQGGGFGLSTHYVVLNSATALVTGVDHDRYMLPNAKIINQGQFEFRQPFVLTPTEVLFINDIQGVLTLTNSLSFMDSNFNLITNTLINYGDMQCNLASLRMRFKFLNNASVSVNSGEFYAEGGALSYGQLNFSPGTTLKSRINPVIFENYPTSTIDGESFTFDIIHSLGLISVRNYFTSTDFTVKSLGNLVFEKGAMVSTFSYFEVFTTFVTFEAHSNFTAKGQLKVNSQSTTTIRGIHNGYYHGIVRNSYLLYDNASVLSGLLDFTIHTGDVEFKAVTEMLQMDEVTCINGDLTLNTNFIVDISTLNLISGIVHGYDEVHILEHLNWQGGGFGLSTHYVVRNSATASATGVAHTRYMLPNAKIINQGQFEFKPPITLLFTEVLFINDHQGVLTLTNSLSFMDSNFTYITNTLINYGDMQCNLVSLRMRFKFLNNGSVSVNSGEFYAEGGAISYGQLYFSPGTTLKSRINHVVFEHYPTSTIDGESFTFDIIDSLGLISVRNYFTSTDFTVQSTGNLVFEKGAIVSESTVFTIYTTFVTFEAHSNFTARGEILVNDESTTTIRGIHDGYYHGILNNSYLLYDDDSVLSGLLDFTIHTGDVEFKAVTEMLQMDEVTCINGDLTLNTNFVVDIFTLNLIAGMVHGYDEVHIVDDLNWIGGGFGVSTYYVVLRQANLDEDHDAPRVMLNFSLLVNRGRMDVFGLLTIRGSQATIMNDHSGLLTFYNQIDLLDVSELSHSILENFGEVHSQSPLLYNEFYFINHGFAHIIFGEIALAGGGYSLGKVQCNAATTVGVTDQLFVFRSGPNSTVEGSHFGFAIRKETGVIEVQTLFSLRRVRIQDHGLFYVTSGAYITDDVSLIVRGTHVIFEGFENPEVNFESLEIETNGIVSFNTDHNIVVTTLVILGGYRGGTDVVNVLEQFTWRLGGGFMHAGLTIAEKGCIIRDFFEKKFVILLLLNSKALGGRNSSLVFNDILIVKDGGKFENYIGRFNDDDIFLLTTTHHTPDDLPVVYVNYGMELYASGETFEFDWELQNKGNITIPQDFVMKLFSGGYDSVSSRVFSEPGSYLEVGAPYPYHYNEDTWVYYNRSILRMKSPDSQISYDGYVCFDQANIGPFGTLTMLKHATICPHSNLTSDGTKVVVEGDPIILCDLTLNTDYFGEPGTRLIITCSLTWRSGTFSGGSTVFITEPANLYIVSTFAGAYHHVHDFTSILNEGYAEITTNLTGYQSANFTNFGQLNMIEGHWVKSFNSSEQTAVLYNYGEVNVLKEDIVFEWNITQFSGLFNLHSTRFFHSETARFSGKFHQHPDTRFVLTKDLVFDNCEVLFDSEELIPRANSTITFKNQANITWNNLPFEFDCDSCELSFLSDTVVSKSPNTFSFKSGLISILDVSSGFILDKFVQTGGTLVAANPATDITLLDDYELINAKVVSNFDWTAKKVEWKSATLTGIGVFTSQDISIVSNDQKICDGPLVFEKALFSQGSVVGSSDCTISTDAFVSNPGSSSTVFFNGCQATLVVRGLLTVQSGTLSFEMGYLLEGVVDVVTRLVLSSCQLVISSNINVNEKAVVTVNGLTFFNEDSFISGDFGGVLNIKNDTIISGMFNFLGCVHVDANVDLVFRDANVSNMIICTTRGRVSFENTHIDSLIVEKLLGGSMIMDLDTLLHQYCLKVMKQVI
ncbi:hypothetical protein GEMRC1_014014 [Eukaryota sp. GEM-RC1]